MGAFALIFYMVKSGNHQFDEDDEDYDDLCALWCVQRVTSIFTKK